MQLSLVRIWSTLKDFSNIDLNSEFQNIRQWWNDHDSGARSWTVVNSNLFIGPTQGTATNDNAPSGDVGEFMTSSVVRSVGVSLSTGTGNNITTLNISPGDWELSFSVGFKTGGATTITAYFAGTNTVSNTVPSGDLLCVPSSSGQYGLINQGSFAPGSGNDVILTSAPFRLSTAASPIIYLNAEAEFSGSTLSCYGSLSARRMR